MQQVLTNSTLWALKILNQISEGVIVINAQYEISFINPAALAILGLQRVEPDTLIDNVYGITNELYQPLLRNFLEKISQDSTVINCTVLLINKLHKEIRVAQRIELLDASDPEAGFKIIFKQLSQESPAKPAPSAELTYKVNTDSSKQFYQLAENSPDIIYIIDVQKRSVVYFNRSELFGYDCKQLETSDGWIGIVHPSDIKKVQAHWNKFIKTAQQSESIEYRIKKKNDAYEWVLNRHSILERTDDNLPKLILLNITIITDRKILEQSLKNSEGRLLALLETTQDLIWSVDEDYNFTAMNSAFKNLFKNNYKTIINIGDNLLDSLPEKINIEWLQLHRRALHGERFTTELKITKKKTEWSFELEFNPIQNENQEINGVCVFARNINSRKKAENEIIKTNFELDSFVYRASHDLRAPLRSILGLLGVIKGEENADQRNTYIALIDKSINKLDAFISDLTNFSRNSRLTIKSEEINFQRIIDECLENLKYMDHASSVTVYTEVEGKDDFLSDSVRMAIIFQNLLSNAIKYCNPRTGNSWIKIKIILTPLSCNISLEDNGIGIKEEYMNQIFNMFFRASNDSYGSGLGLYITKQVVEKLDGVISVSSSAGIGTTFNIKFPIRKKSHTPS